jgi:hypothetical protein
MSLWKRIVGGLSGSCGAAGEGSGEAETGLIWKGG